MYFHHSSIRKYTIALLDMFNNITIPRYNSENIKIKEIKIPIKFGNRDKAYILSEHDMENLVNRNVDTLPRMVLAFESLSKAPQRDTNKLSKINKTKKNESTYKYMYNSVAYDFNFNLFIACRTFTDATMIIEQIAPLFRPDITLKIQELDLISNATSIPVSIGDFSVTLPDELNDDEIRIIRVELPLVLKGNLYLPIKESEILLKAPEFNISFMDKEFKSSKEYEID